MTKACERPILTVHRNKRIFDALQQASFLLEEERMKTMKLIIAEKAELGKDIARAMCGKEGSLPISGNGYTVAACAGHLLELLDPQEIDPKYGKWDLAQLPIYIGDWRKRPVKGKEKLLNTIGSLLQKCDSVIHAGDPDDEGQLIVDEILDYFHYTGKVERVYVNDNIEKNIVRAFDNPVPNEDCRAAGRAALARQIADKSFGINESRLAGLKCGRKGLSVGRVQTPTLGLVVARDRAIKNHEVRKFYELSAEAAAADGSLSTFRFKPSETLLGGEKKIYDRAVLDAVSERYTGKGMSFEVKVKEATENPPLVYNFTVLVSEMNRLFGYSGEQVLKITQSLRDRYKAITYNRTDSQYLKEEHFTQAEKVLGIALKNIGKEYPLDFSIKSKVFNEKYVTAHHGIIPQEIVIDVAEMSEEERNVYQQIVMRYAMQFLPPVRFMSARAVIAVSEGEFVYEGKRVTDSGFKEYFTMQEEKREENEIRDAWFEPGEYEAVFFRMHVTEKKTNPPKPYTEGTLISDMASIAKYVKDENIRTVLMDKDKEKKGENGGIGTTATRTGIISKLIHDRGFLYLDKGKVRASELGMEFYDLLPEDIKSADTTAKWWLLQEKIACGDEEDVNILQDSVIEVFRSHQHSAYEGISLNRKETFGSCPLCGCGVVRIDTPKFKAYACENRDCAFKIFDRPYYSVKPVGDANVRKLLLGGTTNKMTFKSKTKGTEYKARLKLKADGELKLVFERKQEGAHE